MKMFKRIKRTYRKIKRGVKKTLRFMMRLRWLAGML